jgi:hypothetical protein
MGVYKPTYNWGMHKPQLELHPSCPLHPGGIQGIILPHGQHRIPHREADVDELIPGLDVNGLAAMSNIAGKNTCLVNVVNSHGFESHLAIYHKTTGICANTYN